MLGKTGEYKSKLVFLHKPNLRNYMIINMEKILLQSLSQDLTVLSITDDFHNFLNVD